MIIYHDVPNILDILFVMFVVCPICKIHVCMTLWQHLMICQRWTIIATFGLYIIFDHSPVLFLFLITILKHKLLYKIQDFIFKSASFYLGFHVVKISQLVVYNINLCNIIIYINLIIIICIWIWKKRIFFQSVYI